MNSINLLPSRRNGRLKEETGLIVVRRIAIFGCVIIVFLSLLLFALNFDSTSPKLQEQADATIGQLNALHAKTAKVLLTKDRLTTIDSILPNRSSFDTLIAQVSVMLPTDVKIDDFTLNKNSMLLIVSSKSLMSLSNFLDSTSDLVMNKQIFKTINIDSLSADGLQSRYVLTVKADLL